MSNRNFEKPKLTESVLIPVVSGCKGTIRVPGSKSLTNRAILIAALAKGNSELHGVLHSNDTYYMQKAWEKLGVSILKNEHIDLLKIQGCNGDLLPCESPLYVENAGTAARFLTAILPFGTGTYIVTGNDRMRQRPIIDLLQALRQLGCEVRDIKGNGCPPVEVRATGFPGGTVQIPGDQSSQYISGLVMAAPYASQATKILIQGKLVSRTYVEMTRRIMSDFGVQSEWEDENTLLVSPQQKYQGRVYTIEGDASSASYFFGMAAITGGEIQVQGLIPQSTQGDLGLLNILETMGCEVEWNTEGVTVRGKPLKAVDVDMNTMSDVAPTLAVIALFAEGTTQIRNVANMRIKECDRITALVTELRKLGASVEEWKDGLAIEGKSARHGASLATYDDHRMAMALSLTGLKISKVLIENPACVSKTFPDYFDSFFSLLPS